MFCTNCGKKIPDDSKFCTNCGMPVDQGEKPAAPAAPTAPAAPEAPTAPAAPKDPEGQAPEKKAGEPVSAPGQTEGQPDGASAAPKAPSAPEKPKQPKQPKQPKKKGSGGKKAAIIIPIVAVVLVLLAAGGFLLHRKLVNDHYQEAVALADAAAARGDLQTARSGYEEALELKDNGPEAALGLAELYMSQRDYQQAAGLLEPLDLAEDDPSYDHWQNMLTVATLDPTVESVDVSNFPRVELVLACGGSKLPDQVRLYEDGWQNEGAELTSGEGALTVSFETDSVTLESQHRSLELELTLGEYSVDVQAEYETPAFQEARFKLMSTDLSGYPHVKAYFRVEDAYSGENIAGLDRDSFTILESTGGEYVYREVTSAAPLKDTQGINIDLVADKSDSISERDMDLIKQVMTEFVTALRYQNGDRAEVLAFDDIVQQMCCYTGDSALLINGIRNMSTDGATAFYDAVYAGIRSAGLQGGARCVIAFTDGYDNMSWYDAYDVIDYSRQMQVPVYIIGVGYDVERSSLENIAQSTGGQYWDIYDLSDLRSIYDQIYKAQQELYVVEYDADPGVSMETHRYLSAKVMGGGYMGQGDYDFQGRKTVQDMVHTSRYQLVKENLSWEEANIRCQEMGGHLATITSQAEMNELTAMAEAQDVKYVWLGGYTSYDGGNQVFGHWVTGEDFNSFQSWCRDEPSRVDHDGVSEWYIMLWNVPELGGWSWNDQRNDPAAVVKSMVPHMGFICEYEI